MDLSAEAITKIEELAERARDAEDHEFLKDGTSLRITSRADGSVKWIDTPVPPIKASVLTIDDLLAAMKANVINDATASIWVNSQSVTGVLGKYRDGLIKLALKLNPAFSVLQNLKDLDPKSLVRKLKVDLFQCSTNVDLRASVSNLKFEVNSTSEAAIKKNDETIARSVRAKVTAETEIPDEVAFTFSAFPELEFGSVCIVCAVITEPDKGTVSIIPYPGEVDVAVNAAVLQIADHIRSLSGDIHVYCGTCG